MKMQRITAALTAAAAAVVSSVAAFPSMAFAKSAATSYSYEPAFGSTVEMNTDDFTQTEIFDLDIWALAEDIRTQIAGDIIEDSLRISKATITYTLTGEGEDLGVFVLGSGWNSNGEFVEELGCSPWYGEKTGTITTADSNFEGSGVETYGWLGIGASGKGSGDLTLSIAKVDLEVSYTAIENVSVTGTQKYTFDEKNISDEIDRNPVLTVGYEPFEEDFFTGDWKNDSPASLDDISTVGEFASKYGSFELKFKAEDIQGEAEIYAMLETGDESKGEYQQICLPAQDVTEGKNVYSVDFADNIKSAYDTFQSISVHIRSKEEGNTATFTLGLYDSTTITATGTETFKSDITPDEDMTVSVEMPEWWDPAWGSLYEGGISIWYFGGDDEPNTCPVNTVSEFYSTYNRGEIAFNIKELNDDVTCQVVLMTRSGNDFGENIVLADNIKLQKGENVVKFDLPKITYIKPDIWGLRLRMSADKEIKFTIGKPESSTPSIPSTPSTPSTSEPTTSEPTASNPATSDTNEVFKTEDKPIENIMEEVKPDTTASIEVAAADTTIKANVFETAKEKKVTLELTLENGVKWAIKAETIGDAAADVNINVNLNTSNIPAASVDAVASGKSSMQISLAHNGSFGFEANITIPVAPVNNGKVANLFHFNNGALEFVASVTVSNGEATLPFSHASEYVIVFDEKSMGASENTSDTSSVPETTTNPGTGSAGVGVFAAFAAASAAAVIICRKNKHN